MKNKLFTAALLLALSSRPVHSADITEPQFPSCANPTGELLVEYESGLHGILGIGLQEGYDSVWRVDEKLLYQCFCPDEGVMGIQTNFWKTGYLSQSKLDTLKNLGWSFIPTGLSWGLDDKAYLAKNVDYICRGNGGGGGGKVTPTPTPSQSPSPEPTVTPSGTAAPSSPGTTATATPSPESVGRVLGGYADAGGNTPLYILAAASVISLLVRIKLVHKKRLN